MIKFFIKNSGKPDFHCGSPVIIKDLINFFNEDSPKFSYSSLFRVLLEELQRPRDESQLDIFILYVIEMFSYIKSKVVTDKKKYLIPIYTELRKFPFGYFRGLLSKKLNDSNYDSLMAGMRIISQHNPLIALEFLDSGELMQKPLEVLK
jgi:hypothetical protein